jgi:hypothetical protein
MPAQAGINDLTIHLRLVEEKAIIKGDWCKKLLIPPKETPVL